MANKIQVKRSAVASKVPTTTDLDLGEIAINTYDGKMYIKKDNGTPSVVEIGAGGGVSDGDKGDIVVSSSGTVWTVDTGVIGTSKLGGDITTAGKALLDDADASAQRTTLAAAGTGVSNTFSANQIIETTDNTNAALRVTQLGTGLALRIEDETNPDSSPFVVDASGNVGIGTATPISKLDFGTSGAVSGTAGLPSISLYSNGNTRYGFNISSGSLDISSLASNSRISFYVGGDATAITEVMRINSSGNFFAASSSSFGFNSTTLGSGSQDVFLTRRGAANLRFGAADAAAPVAQTLSVQSVVAGTTNTAGANLTITGSQGTGTGAGGNIVFQVAPAGSSGTAQNALVNILSLFGTRSAEFLIGSGGYLDFSYPSNSIARIFGSSAERGLRFANVSVISWASTTADGVSDLIISRRGAANLRFGAADAAAPVAQTLSVQSVVAGTSNTAGANLTITGSQGTGTGAGGSIIFQTAPAGSSGTAQNALNTALTLTPSGVVSAGSGLIENGATISLNHTITTGKNAMSAGPVTIANGVSVTVPSGSRWVVL